MIDKLPEAALKAFAVIGILILILSTAFVIGLFFILIRDAIDHLKYKHRIKHRFDGPPLAKCYCKDCEHHNDHSNVCYAHSGWYTADNWFCWCASPRGHDEENSK